MRAVDIEPLPEHRRRARRGGPRPARATSCRWRRPPTTRWAGSRPTSTGAPRCPASTPSASAPAPASTAPTGWPRTRSRSASCSAAAPRSRRSHDPEPPRRPRAPAAAAPAPPRPPAETRAALWRLGGPRARRRGPARARRRPVPARAPDRRRLPRPRGEPRARTSAPTTPRPTPRSTRMHALVDGRRGRASSAGSGASGRERLFLEAMARLASGVAVITARRPDGHPCGLAATSVSSYSAHPPSLLLSISTARAATTRSPAASTSACTSCARTS